MNQQQLAELETLAESAKVTDGKIRDFNRESQKIAEKWQDWAEGKRKSVSYSEES